MVRSVDMQVSLLNVLHALEVIRRPLVGIYRFAVVDFDVLEIVLTQVFPTATDKHFLATLSV